MTINIKICYCVSKLFQIITMPKVKNKSLPKNKYLFRLWHKDITRYRFYNDVFDIRDNMSLQQAARITRNGGDWHPYEAHRVMITDNTPKFNINLDIDTTELENFIKDSDPVAYKIGKITSDFLRNYKENKIEKAREKVIIKPMGDVAASDMHRKALIKAIQQYKIGGFVPKGLLAEVIASLG